MNYREAYYKLLNENQSLRVELVNERAISDNLQNEINSIDDFNILVEESQKSKLGRKPS
ncbi:MAG: hypothetical protein GY928_16270 [Colwellia sp.]|nr:hypothetical protein [Colwellia sp.]